MATQQGCGALTAQEQAIFAIVSNGPRIDFHGSTEASLSGPNGSLRLQRETGPEPAAAVTDQMLLAGTAWEVASISGKPVGELSRRTRARLVFEAERWSLDAGCSPLSGPWRQAGVSLKMEVDTPQAGPCSPLLNAEDEAIRAMIAAGPLHVVGPNRELVIGGGDHWLTAEYDRAYERERPSLLRGEWRVEQIDGRAPKAMPRPPSLIFGKYSYAVWDGCNHTEGVLLIAGSRLFTRGSGVTTLANCLPDPDRQRVPAIVASNPRIAMTQGGGLALVSASGTLRLSRLSKREFGTMEQIGLRGPRMIDLLGPNGRLILRPGNRFTVDLGCGTIEGEWRAGQPARFSPGPTERTAPACDLKPGSAAAQLSRFFTGDVLAVTGPNRDIVLLVNEDRSLHGRIAE